MNITYLKSSRKNLLDRATTLYTEIWNKEPFISKLGALEMMFCPKETSPRQYVTVSNHLTDSLHGMLQGYIRNHSLPIHASLEQHMESFLMQQNWPLPEEFSGSYSAIVRTETPPRIIICNDVLGFYPIYYYCSNDTLLCTSSLILAGALTGEEFDPLGVSQRLIRPDYSNFGRRTILKGVKRLLPGGAIVFDHSTHKIVESKTDHRLYAKMKNMSLKDAALSVWESIEREIRYALNYDPEVYIAMSGGLDSRIILGAVDPKKKMVCVTYGGDNYYETKIARRCAEVQGAEFRNVDVEDWQFPTQPIFDYYTRTTEAIGINHWLGILETIRPSDSPVLLYGDMCEAIVGRNIQTFTSRNARIKGFLTNIILQREFTFKNASSEAFLLWKERIQNSFLSDLRKTDFEFLGITRQKIEEGIRDDLDELFNVMAKHELPYAELYDELFAWFTHSRIPMGKQILISQNQFYGLCPMMASGVLIATANLHPGLRLNYRLMHKLYKTIPGLKKLSHIPTAQIPFIPVASPRFLRFLVWGLRSKVDQIFIRRIMNKRNPNLRYRVLPSFNWVKAYQKPYLQGRVQEYFDSEFINGTHVWEMIRNRQLLAKWPLSTFDVASMIGLNLEMKNIAYLCGRYA